MYDLEYFDRAMEEKHVGYGEYSRLMTHLKRVLKISYMRPLEKKRINNP